jgi:hypothetical protein
MTKKIVYQKRISSHCWVGEYLKWECGCCEIIFSDRGPAFSRKLCGNDHEKTDVTDKRSETASPV